MPPRQPAGPLRTRWCGWTFLFLRWVPARSSVQLDCVKHSGSGQGARVSAPSAIEAGTERRRRESTVEAGAGDRGAARGLPHREAHARHQVVRVVVPENVERDEDDDGDDGP